MTACQQSLPALTLATRSPGSSATSPTGQTCSRMASRLSVKCTTASHPSPTSTTVSNMSRLCTQLVSPLLPLLDPFSDFMTTQEGSRIYTPVRLGFPRETLDGASYEGHKIPPGMVCLLPDRYFHGQSSNIFCPARHHEPDGRQPRPRRLRPTRRVPPRAMAERPQGPHRPAGSGWREARRHPPDLRRRPPRVPWHRQYVLPLVIRASNS